MMKFFGTNFTSKQVIIWNLRLRSNEIEKFIIDNTFQIFGLLSSDYNTARITEFVC